MRIKPLLLALTCLAVVGTAQAQWKWRDAQGRPQYSDTPPPPGTPDKDILQRPASARQHIVIAPVGATPASAASAPQPAPSAPSKADQEAAARKKAEQEKQEARKKEAESRAEAQRRENCRNAQSNLRSLQNGARLTRTNEQGEIIFMDDAQRQAEVARMQQLVSTECR